MSRPEPAGTAQDVGVRSPCVSVCTMDDTLGVCVGCYRTLGEIAAWSVLDDDVKRAVLAALPARRVAAVASGRATATPDGARGSVP